MLVHLDKDIALIVTIIKYVSTIDIHEKFRVVIRDNVNINRSSIALKKTSKSYKANTCDDGLEVFSKIIKGLLKAKKQEKKKFQMFWEIRCFKKTERIFSPITWKNLDTRMKNDICSKRRYSSSLDCCLKKPLAIVPLTPLLVD